MNTIHKDSGSNRVVINAMISVFYSIIKLINYIWQSTLTQSDSLASLANGLS